MKRVKSWIVLFILFMAVSLLVFIRYYRNYNYKQRDIVYYNDALNMVEADYALGIGEEEIERKYNCNIIIAKELDDPELSVYYRNNALVLDLCVDGKYIGKVAWSDNYEYYDSLRTDFYNAALTLWKAVFVGGIMLILGIYSTVIKPMDDLKRFSEKIAKGNLTEALPMHRSAIFTEFAEGFDIMREELKTYREREMEAEKARKELVTDLGHDIRTPIAVIKATCELMELKLKRKTEQKMGDDFAEDDELINDMLDKIETISVKADTVSSIITNVMHATLEELEKIEVEPKEERSTLIEEMISALKGYGRIILDGHIPPCLVYMDRLKMEQVLDNIVGNSHKYAGTDIHVSFGETEGILKEDGSSLSFIEVLISDSGPGAFEEELPLLAEKYYRGSNATDEEGYGLGLYLVRLYMKKQGGDAEYYNDNGFTVKLLLRKV